MMDYYQLRKSFDREGALLIGGLPGTDRRII
jgi:hypothetical protein